MHLLFQLAQVVPLLPTPTPVPSFVAQALTDSRFYDGLFTLIAGLFSMWVKSKLTTSQKVLVSVVKGVEYATSLPEVQAMEQKIKQAITAQATTLGVQADLHAIVQNVTK